MELATTDNWLLGGEQHFIDIKMLQQHIGISRIYVIFCFLLNFTLKSKCKNKNPNAQPMKKEKQLFRKRKRRQGN